MMLPSLLWHPPLRKRNFIISITDNFAIKLIYKHLDHRKVSLKKNNNNNNNKNEMLFEEHCEKKKTF